MNDARPQYPIPEYRIRGIPVQGFRDMEQCVSALFAGGSPHPGTLIAINAEKVMAADRDARLRELMLQEGNCNYADGISVVCSIRRKYPGAQVERIAGADLWEALMQRAGWNTVSVPVNHRHRGSGVSKYNNLNRALVGIRDLRGVAWLIARNRRTAVEEITP